MVKTLNLYFSILKCIHWLHSFQINQYAIRAVTKIIYELK